MKRIILTLFATLALTTSAFAHSSEHSHLAKLLKKVMSNSVVNISSQGTMPSGLQSDNPANQNKDNGFIKLGSGVVIKITRDKEEETIGYIVTNAHVIADASTIVVTTQDGRVFDAKKVGEDPAFDLAVIKVETHSKLEPLQYADSNNIEIGDDVAAIGSPFGLHESASAGIVSAINRSEPDMNNLTNYIQTDAPINPGNSGGALINMDGQLVGINTWIVSKDGGNLGIGFAIPSNIVRAVADQLIQYGKVEHGQLGIMVQSITPELAQALGVQANSGAIITDVKKNTPAEKSGLEPGDIITKFNDETIHNNVELVALVNLTRPGNKFELTINRNDKTKTIQTGTEAPEKIIAAMKESNPYLFGTRLQNFSFSTTGEGITSGVLVLSREKNSNAANAGVLPGDVIIAADGAAVSNIDELEAIVKKQQGTLLLNVRRGSGSFFIPIDRDQPFIALGEL